MLRQRVLMATKVRFFHSMNNLYDGTSVKQIVGHTRVKEVCEVAGVILVDCLDSVEQSYRVTCS